MLCKYLRRWATLESDYINFVLEKKKIEDYRRLKTYFGLNEINWDWERLPSPANMHSSVETLKQNNIYKNNKQIQVKNSELLTFLSFLFSHQAKTT